jgi:hypothetical protein
MRENASVYARGKMRQFTHAEKMRLFTHAEKMRQFTHEQKVFLLTSCCFTTTNEVT